jgi:hypothetical protein
MGVMKKKVFNEICEKLCFDGIDPWHREKASTEAPRSGGGLKFNLFLSYLPTCLLVFTYLHILTFTLFSQNTKNQKR